MTVPGVPGESCPTGLKNPRLAHFYVEATDLHTLDILKADAGPHVRAAIRAYVAAQLLELGEIIGGEQG